MVFKNCAVASVRFRPLTANEGGQLEASTLREQIERDKERGFIPFLVNEFETILFQNLLYSSNSTLIL